MRQAGLHFSPRPSETGRLAMQSLLFYRIDGPEHQPAEIEAAYDWTPAAACANVTPGAQCETWATGDMELAAGGRVQHGGPGHESTERVV